MYLLEKRPGPKGVVRYREVSAIWDVRYKEVLLYFRTSCASDVAYENLKKVPITMNKKLIAF